MFQFCLKEYNLPNCCVLGGKSLIFEKQRSKIIFQMCHKIIIILTNSFSPTLLILVDLDLFVSSFMNPVLFFF